MADAITNNVTDITSPVNYQLMRGLLSAAKKKLPMFNGTVPGSLEKNTGAPAVIWQRIENLTPVTTALAEPSSTPAFLNGRTLVQPSVSTVTATPLKYGNPIVITEEVDLIQMNVRSARLMETLGANAGESLNELMIDVFQGLTAASIRNASAAATTTAINDEISANDIKYAVNYLNRNSAMSFSAMGEGMDRTDTKTLREAYYGVCHPDVEEDIRGLGTGFIPVEQYAAYMDTLPGEFGSYGGVRWCSSPLAGFISAGTGSATSVAGVRITGSSADIYSSFIYGREAVGTIGLGINHTDGPQQMYDNMGAVELIYKAPGSSGVADPLNEVGSLGWKSWFAGAILNHNWCVEIKSAASRLT